MSAADRNPLIPDWSIYKGSLLALPGIQVLVDREKLQGLENQVGVEGFTWLCCGIYETVIGRGGPVAEEPVEPSLEPLGRLDPIKQPVPSRDIDDVIDDGVFNFLAWRLYTPIKAPGGSCIEYEGTVYSLLSQEPWRSSTPVSCLKPRITSMDKISLGPASIEAKASLQAGPLRAYDVGQGIGVCGPRGCTFDADRISINLEALDYRIHLLYPLHYRPAGRVRPGRGLHVKALSMVVETPRGSIAFSASRGFTAVLESGKITLEPQGSLRISRGSETIAYRLLIEDAAVFRAQRAPRNMGHARPGAAAGLLLEAGRRITIAVANPSYSDSLFEARFRLPVDEVIVYSLLDNMSIPTPDGLARIPAPRGFAAMVEATVRRRLRFKRLPQGGAEAASH